MGEPEHDMELDLVHELIHLHITPNDGDDSSWRFDIIEQGVECLAYAFVTLNREVIGE